MDESIKVAVVDDSVELRAEAAALFARQPGFEFCGAFPEGEAAITALPSTRPHVVLVDLNLPGCSGIEVVRSLRTSLPSTRVLILTIEHDGRRLIEALAAGAVGYLVKSTPPERLVEAVREAVSGGSPISSNVARLLVERFQTAPPAESRDATLTARERGILGRFATGKRAKEIAAELDVSISTVRAAVRTIYSKLQARSLAEAVAKLRS